MTIRLRPKVRLFHRLELTLSIRREWPGGLPGKTWRHYWAALTLPIGYSLEYHKPLAQRLRFGRHRDGHRRFVYLGLLWLYADVKPRAGRWPRFASRTWGPFELVWT